MEKRKALAKRVQELEGKLAEADAGKNQAQQLERQCSQLQAAHSSLKRQLSTSQAQAERSQAAYEQAAQLERVRGARSTDIHSSCGQQAMPMLADSMSGTQIYALPYMIGGQAAEHAWSSLYSTTTAASEFHGQHCHDIQMWSPSISDLTARLQAPSCSRQCSL